MFAHSLNRSIRHRRLIFFFLLTGLLAAGAGVLPASAQQPAPPSNDTIQRYGWGSAGIGGGRTGPGISVAGGVPITDQWFVGGRYVRTEEITFNLCFKSPCTSGSPPDVTWDAGPLVGLVEQGRWGHLSLATGVAVVGSRRPDEPDTRSTTLGIPLDVQAFFTPIRYLGIGVHGYANVNPENNLLGVSLQLQVRIPQ